MAMGPERSKPLHNFTLPYLKWGNQRFLRCMKVDSAAGATSGTDHRLRRRSSPSKFGESSTGLAAVRGEVEQLRQQPESKNQHRRFGAATSGSGSRDGGEEGIDEVRKKIMLDLREVVDKMKKSILREEVSEDEAEEEAREAREKEKPWQREKQVEKNKEKEAEEAATEEVRPWNLRTRRGAASRAPIGEAGSSTLHLNNNSGNNNRGLRIEERRANYSPLRSDGLKSSMKRDNERERGGAAAVTENKEKQKFSVSLRKKEIEEDFMAMVGRRPPRRPKKRPRNVQKQLDTLFPGLWLTEVTPDSYKVPESAENGKR